MTADTTSSAEHAPRLQSYTRAVEQLLSTGDTLRAAQTAADAVEKGCESATLLSLAALHWLNRRQTIRALDFAEKARALAPRNAEVLNMLGMALVSAGRPREAVAVYGEALRHAPAAAHIRLNRGQALEGLSDIERARIEYERALSLRPGYVGAMARLAALAGLRGDAAEARKYAQGVLAQDRRNEAALLALAMADLEEQQYEQVLARAAGFAGRPNTSPVNASIAKGLAADALDGLGKEAGAFAAYEESNALMRSAYAPLFEAGRESAMQRVTRLVDYFADAGPEWRARTPSYAAPVTMHVFLLGFARSGTTLLERVMDAHPQIEAMPERECLTDAIADLTGSPEALQRLSTLQGDDLARYRKAYWDRVSENWRAPSHGVFVDKMPFNTVWLCLIGKLFPDAKILFAIRDPRDVVFSCFRRRFGMTSEIYQLLSLENAAQYYDQVMRLADLYRERLDLNVHEIHYEKLIENFEGEMHKIGDFVGLARNASMLRYLPQDAVKNVGTASAAQVARGLYRQGIGQWRRYRAQMQPVLPILAPWVKRFGYGED
jgi:Tfp pilus assembly protein PilF